MIDKDSVTNQRPEYAYHLLRAALETFQKNPENLDQEEMTKVLKRAEKSFQIESLVLSSVEAAEVVIAESHLDRAITEIESRYDSKETYLSDLHANGLDEIMLRRALGRELRFDSVMQRIGARHTSVGDVDVRLFYEMHRERFQLPEQRQARHILITINQDFEDNTPEAAHARILDIQRRIGGRSNRFASLARRYSECPSALDGGKLGQVKRGQLYTELDAELFSLEEDGISDVIETDAGYHLVWCEKVRPARTLSLSRSRDKIIQLLSERRRRNCQKAWIEQLRGATETS